MEHIERNDKSFNYLNNSFNLAPLDQKMVLVLQDVIGPIFTSAMFIITFVFDIIEKTDALWVKIPICILVMAMALFYIARFRKVWKEGTSLHHQNSYYKNRNQ